MTASVISSLRSHAVVCDFHITDRKFLQMCIFPPHIGIVEENIVDYLVYDPVKQWFSTFPML